MIFFKWLYIIFYLLFKKILNKYLLIMIFFLKINIKSKNFF